MKKLVLLALAATALAPVSANAATVITFEASGNGQAPLPATYQPILNGYNGDGGALGVTITWGGTGTSNRATNGGVTDHTPGTGGLGYVGYDYNEDSRTITFDRAVKLPSFFYANYNSGSFPITFTASLNGNVVATITRTYVQPTGYTWIEETGLAGIALDSFTFSGPQYKQLDDITVTAVPEPATWAMMLLGFGMVGFGLRSRRNGKVTTKVAFA